MKLASTAFVLLSLTSAKVAAAANLGNNVVVNSARRLLNFGSLLGNPKETAATPYDRVLGHPVFQVTTAWGSAYMNMEKLNDVDDSGSSSSVISTKNPNQLKSISEEQNEYRTVSLYFMDPDDALATHAELKQMDAMQKSDIRITSVSLGKALRSSANLGRGLVTGYPVEPLDGNLKSVEEGGSLRHKILPPKRQLFYAARCIGKERVGFVGENPAEEATSAVLGNSALEGLNLMRRREQADRKSSGNRKPKTVLGAQNPHMDGYTGIPVFWAQGMQRRLPKLKQLISGNREETPMFFNYEDLMGAWTKMKKEQPRKKLPDQPTVEVFNLWDVLTSMEKEKWKTTKAQKYDWAKPVRERFGKKESPGLDAITFVPSSRAIDYKERISAQGNGKCRLKAMR